MIQKNSDYKDLLREFENAEVRYLIVGGYAVSEHTEPRYTKDLDLWVNKSPENAERIISALRSFGAPLRDVTVEEFESPGFAYQIGVPPSRIDILTELDGLMFEECWERRKSLLLDEINVHFISIPDLIVNKEIAARPHDLEDARKLRKVNERR
jgi:predicted nucleotidyltransferase